MSTISRIDCHHLAKWKVVKESVVYGNIKIVTKKVVCQKCGSFVYQKSWSSDTTPEILETTKKRKTK